MKAEEKKSKSWYQKNKEEIIDTITIKRQMEYTGKLKGEINDRKKYGRSIRDHRPGPGR